jgi:hypothetical protein
VLLAVTSKGERVLRELSLHHRGELRLQGPALVNALRWAMQSNLTSDGTLPETKQRVRAKEKS